MSYRSNKTQVISFYFVDGIIEVVFREPNNEIYDIGRPIPDKVWKEIYGVVDGKITLLKTINGRHEPSHPVKEKITFPEES
jgi:hypothetical protein